MHKIEVGRTYKDGLGRDVRIVCTDAHNPDGPVVGLVTIDRNHSELAQFYREDGRAPSGYPNGNLILPEEYVKLDDAVRLISEQIAAYRDTHHPSLERKVDQLRDNIKLLLLAHAKEITPNA